MRRGSIALPIAVSIIALDFSLKEVLVNSLSPGESVPLIPGFLYLSRVHNTGSAFGIMEGRNLFLIVVGVGVFLYLLWGLLRGYFLGPLAEVGLGLVLGGAVGNLIDRVVRGYVVDYIDFRFFPAFNIADCCIVVGAGLLGLYILRGRGWERSSSS